MTDSSLYEIFEDKLKNKIVDRLLDGEVDPSFNRDVIVETAHETIMEMFEYYINHEMDEYECESYNVDPEECAGFCTDDFKEYFFDMAKDFESDYTWCLEQGMTDPDEIYEELTA